MNIRIEWLSHFKGEDNTGRGVEGCQDCLYSADMAQGALVYIEDILVIDQTPEYTDNDYVSYEEWETYHAILKHLGHNVEYE